MESLPRRTVLQWLGSAIAAAMLPAAGRKPRKPRVGGFGSTLFGSTRFRS